MMKNLTRVATTAAAAALMCAPAIAHADPITSAIGAIVTSLSSLSASTVLAGLATMALNYGASMLLGKMTQKDVKEKGVKGKLESGGDLPMSFILGEYATAGKLIYVNEYGGDNNGILVMVISLSEMPVSALSNFLWVNGEKTTIDFDSGTDSDGFYAVPRYHKYNRDYLKVKFYDGAQSSADTFLTSTFGSDPDKPWTADMIGRGCAFAIVQCRYSRKGVWSGIPEFKFVVRGMKLYNPAKDSTNGGSGSHRWTDQSTWEWSENPKVMQYNIIRGIYYRGQDWIFGGQNLSAYQMPSAYWIAAINHCNETVTKGNGDVIKRYTAGCEITVDQQPIDVIKELDKCCAGYTTEYGGVWKAWAGQPGSSVFFFTDADIIITEEQQDDLFRPIQELYNGVRATYTSPAQGWVSKDAPPRIFSDLEDADGYSLIAEISLPYVTEPNQVQRLMRAAVLDSRKQITHQLRMPPKAYLLDVRDVVSWTSARNGYSAKKFMVIAIEDLPDFTQFVTLREIDPADYDWDTEYELDETTGPLLEVKPGALAVDFTVTADQIDNASGGKDRPAIKVEWDWQAPDLDIRRIEYEVRLTGTTKVIKRGVFHNVMRDTDNLIEHSAFRFGKTYQIRFYPEPERSWRDTAWTSWKSVTLFDIDVPGRPTLDQDEELGNGGRFEYSINVAWTEVASTAADYSVRIVRTLSGVTKTYYRKAEGSPYRLTGVVPGASYEISVRAIVGPEKGDWSDSRTLTVVKKVITAPSRPTLDPISDLGDDGRLDYFLDIDWTGAYSIATYAIKIEQTAIPGFTRTYYKYSDETAYRLQNVTPGTTYNVSVRAVIGGEKSDWSTARSITVTKRNASPTAPTSLTVTGGYKKNVLTWAESPDKDFKRVNIYKASSNNFLAANLVARTPNKKWTDNDVGNDETAYYWITFENTSQSESAKFPSSNTGGRSATTVKINTPDLAAGAVTADTTASDALAAPTVAVPTIGDIKSNSDASVTVSLRSTISANVVGAVRYDVQLWAASSSGGTYTKVASQSIPTDDDGDLPIASFKVNTETYYKVRWRARNFAGWPGTWSALKGTSGGGGVLPSISSLTVSAPTGISAPYGVGSPYGGKMLSVRWPAEDFASRDYSHTLLMIHTTNDAFDAGLNGLILSSDAVWAFGVTYGVAFSLGGLAPGQYYAWAYNVSKAGVVTSQYPAGSGYSFTIPSLDTAQLAHGAGFEIATAYTASAFGTFGTSEQEIQSATLAHGSGASLVEIYTEFTNVSGGARDFFIAIYADGSLIRGRTQSLADKEQASVTFHDLTPGGSSTTYSVGVQSDSASNNVQQRYLRAVSRW